MELQLNFEDFLKTVENKPITKKSAEIRLDLSRLAPQHTDKPQNKQNHNTSTKSRKGKRSRKVWETQELKEELESKQLQRNDGDNSMRAKTRVHLHKILLHKFNEINNIKKRKLNNNTNNINTKKYDKLNYLCNEIETAIFMKSNQEINKNYMEYSRDLLFNLKRNTLLQTKLIKTDIDPQQFVSMNYTQLASDKLIKKRKQIEKERLEKLDSSINDNDDWIEITIQCTNCGNKTAKYRDKKILFESTKSAVFGSASSKQQMVDITCMKCSYSFKYEISFN